MGSTALFTAPEFQTFALNVQQGRQKALFAGYTNPVVAYFSASNDGAGGFSITVDELGVAKPTMLTTLQAAGQPVVTVLPTIRTITADGVQKATFALTGPPGHAVALAFSGALKIDKVGLTLDGGGEGTFEVGPFDVGTRTAARGVDVRIECAEGGCFTTLACQVVVV